MICDLVKMSNILPCNPHYFTRLEKLLNIINGSPSKGIRHHIIPRSWGGSDLESNILSCTKREHLLIHKLMTKSFFEDVSMQYADRFMQGTFGYQNETVYVRLGLTETELKDKIFGLYNSDLTVHRIAKELGIDHNSVLKYGNEFFNDVQSKRNFKLAYAGTKKTESHKQSMRKPKSESHKEKLVRNLKKRTTATFLKGGATKRDHHAQMAGYIDDSDRTRHIKELRDSGTSINKISKIVKADRNVVYDRIAQ